jgi:hypothetical protein
MFFVGNCRHIFTLPGIGTTTTSSPCRQSCPLPHYVGAPGGDSTLVRSPRVRPPVTVQARVAICRGINGPNDQSWPFRRLARDYERLATTMAGYHWVAFPIGLSVNLRYSVFTTCGIRLLPI